MPPPPPPPPGPLKATSGPIKTTSGPSDRSALIQSIQKGKALKKTVTNDRSAPLVSAKTNNNNSYNQSSSNGSKNGPSSKLPGIGGIFADGLPSKSMLKSTPGRNNPKPGNSPEKNIASNQSARIVAHNHSNFANNLQNILASSRSNLSATSNLGSTSSLTSSSSSNAKTEITPPTKPKLAPPPPPPANSKPKISLSKPQAPPSSMKPIIRTRSFNRGRGRGGNDEAPPISSPSYDSQTMPSRRSGPKMRPLLPSGPAPPPPSKPLPPPPTHRGNHAPPPSMQHSYSSLIMTSNGGGGNAPPTPPTRRQSLSTKSMDNCSFEQRFLHMFKSVHNLPPPEPFRRCVKTYPSRHSQQPTMTNALGRQGSRRGPAPPPPPSGGQPRPRFDDVWTTSEPIPV